MGVWLLELQHASKKRRTVYGVIWNLDGVSLIFWNFPASFTNFEVKKTFFATQLFCLHKSQLNDKVFHLFKMLAELDIRKKKEKVEFFLISISTPSIPQVLMTNYYMSEITQKKIYPQFAQRSSRFFAFVKIKTFFHFVKETHSTLWKRVIFQVFHSIRFCIVLQRLSLFLIKKPRSVFMEMKKSLV